MPVRGSLSTLSGVVLLVVLIGCAGEEPRVGAVSGGAASTTGEAPLPAGPAPDPDELTRDLATGEPAPDQPAAGGPIRKLPDLVGKGLQAAQDRAQAAGFGRMTSHDALGRKRLQVYDRNWKVCFQTPPAGTQPVGVRVDFATVQLDERCPAKDKGRTTVRAAAGTMPDLRGLSLPAAREALGGDASISLEDGSGKDRFILVPTNWRVCAQKPKAGAKYDGVPVTLTVVKYSEKC